MKITYRISEKDYMEARDLFIANELPRYRRVSRRVLPWLGGIVVLEQVLYLVFIPQPNVPLVIVGFMIGLYLLYCGLALRRYFRRLYQKDHRFKHDFTAEVSEQGIRVITPFSDGLVRWNGFVRFLESNEIFLLFISHWNFVVFPKRAFGPGEAYEFRATLGRYIHATK
jgi:hypothetical protein